MARTRLCRFTYKRILIVLSTIGSIECWERFTIILNRRSTIQINWLFYFHHWIQFRTQSSSFVVDFWTDHFLPNMFVFYSVDCCHSVLKKVEHLAVVVVVFPKAITMMLILAVGNYRHRVLRLEMYWSIIEQTIKLWHWPGDLLKKAW